MITGSVLRLGAVALAAAAAIVLVPCRAAEVTARDLLSKLSAQYYDAGRAGLARASCYVESKEILEQFDKTARAILSKPDYEAVIVPGKPVDVKVRDLPATYGRDARGGVAVYCLGAQLVLNAVFKVLDAVPELLAPDTVEKAYDVTLDGAPGKWRILLTAKAVVDEKGKPVLPWARKDGQDDLRSKEQITLMLDREDHIASIVRTSVGQTEKTAVTLVQADKQWLIKALDTAVYDPEDRLIERRIVSIVYGTQKGIYLPTKISSRVVNKDGHTVKRRDEPNPVTIRFSQYRVELRQ